MAFDWHLGPVRGYPLAIDDDDDDDDADECGPVSGLGFGSVTTSAAMQPPLETGALCVRRAGMGNRRSANRLIVLPAIPSSRLHEKHKSQGGSMPAFHRAAMARALQLQSVEFQIARHIIPPLSTTTAAESAVREGSSEPLSFPQEKERLTHHGEHGEEGTTTAAKKDESKRETKTAKQRIMNHIIGGDEA
ncbi:hypothetical protein AND_002734 [Anopheles darlingi]|uniref:Uncharacterized protein n=1 Tax=Anopheles darlingi TaxID=43151 RepID=W5JMD1_ANODA|nr:hypothetical protein AND_002734 [Anopheles darlingi]